MRILVLLLLVSILFSCKKEKKEYYTNVRIKNISEYDIDKITIKQNKLKPYIYNIYEYYLLKKGQISNYLTFENSTIILSASIEVDTIKSKYISIQKLPDNWVIDPLNPSTMPFGNYRMLIDIVDLITDSIKIEIIKEKD